jgi:hypothetical protein
MEVLRISKGSVDTAGMAKKPGPLFWLTCRHSDGRAAGAVVIEPAGLLHIPVSRLRWPVPIEWRLYWAAGLSAVAIATKAEGGRQLRRPESREERPREGVWRCPDGHYCVSNSYANLSTGSPSPERRRWIPAWGRTLISPHAVPALGQDHSKSRGFCRSACPAAWPLNVVAAAGAGVLREATAREEDEIGVTQRALRWRTRTRSHSNTSQPQALTPPCLYRCHWSSNPGETARKYFFSD